MARGRFIVNEITKDKRINQLSDDTSRLAFTWLITFADCEGRTMGDPAIVRSMLFPRRDDVTIERMRAYIQEWADIGLIIWYEAKDDWYIFFPAFDRHNSGIRKDREAPSNIPSPELVQSNSGVTQEQLTVNININDKENESQDNKKEIKRTATGINAREKTAAAVFTKFQNDIQPLTPGASDVIGDWIDTYPEQWIIDAIQEAVNNNARRINYIDAILKNWQSNGRNAPKPARAEKQASETY